MINDQETSPNPSEQNRETISTKEKLQNILQDLIDLYLALCASIIFSRPTLKLATTLFLTLTLIGYLEIKLLNINAALTTKQPYYEYPLFVNHQGFEFLDMSSMIGFTLTFETHFLDIEHPITDLLFPGIYAHGYNDKQVRVVFSTYQELVRGNFTTAEFPIPSNEEVISYTVSHNGSVFILMSYPDTARHDYATGNAYVRSYDIATRELIHETVFEITSASGYLPTLGALSPNGEWVIVSYPGVDSQPMLVNTFDGSRAPADLPMGYRFNGLTNEGLFITNDVRDAMNATEIMLELADATTASVLEEVGMFPNGQRLFSPNMKYIINVRPPVLSFNETFQLTVLNLETKISTLYPSPTEGYFEVLGVTDDGVPVFRLPEENLGTLQRVELLTEPLQPQHSE
jgi:hypothetical protein